MEGSSRVHGVISFLKFALIAFLIATPFRYFVAQPFIVSGASMEPHFSAHEYLVVDRLTYRFEKPERGDVIVFRYPLDPSTHFLKRIVGLPGEEVTIRGPDITITNSEGSVTLDESYASREIMDDSRITLAADEYFVLGDNRAHSTDSRTWGPLQEKFILGRAFLRLFPPQTASFMPGDASQHDE
ncbi:MAG: signal peptidase I [Minisyncoccia bacterium]